MVLVATTAMRKSVPARRGAGIEPEPAEGQDEGAEQWPSECCAAAWVDAAVLVVLADARSDQPGRRSSAITPPCMCTTEEPAKSTWPWPRPKLTPSCESQPPPQTQLPNTGYMIVPMQQP